MACFSAAYAWSRKLTLVLIGCRTRGVAPLPSVGFARRFSDDSVASLPGSPCRTLTTSSLHPGAKRPASHAGCVVSIHGYRWCHVSYIPKTTAWIRAAFTAEIAQRSPRHAALRMSLFAARDIQSILRACSIGRRHWPGLLHCNNDL